MDKWNPEQYQRFQSERSQPFWDLATRVDFTRARTLLDLGCGTGGLTAELHANRGLKSTIGVDPSPAMLHKASRWKAPGLQFVSGEAESYAPNQRFDVV